MAESPRISIVLPAYQEASRIGNTVSHWSKFLDSSFPDAEIIVVCDGCTDETASVAKNRFAGERCSLTVIDLPVNRGKGAAVREGVMKARGELIIFTDADMSYRPEVLTEFIERLKNGADLAIAQRQKDEKYPGLGRRLLAVLSRFLVGNLVLPGLRDTQAGFKAFRRDVARDLFGVMTIERFLFDLEILVIARYRKYKIEKVYVPWEDRAGSTVRIYVDTLRAFRDLVIILCRKWSGCYDRPGNSSG